MSSPRTTPVKPVPTERKIDRSMRARQLASTVRQGRRISIIILDENPVEGYLAGWDAETYFMVYPLGDQVFKELVPKNNILKIVLFDESTFREEPYYEEMNGIVRPFRDMINAEYFEKKNEPAS
jgi:hypothetical protein